MSQIRSVGRRLSHNIGSPQPQRSRSAERTTFNGSQLVYSDEVGEDGKTSNAAGRDRLASDSSLSKQFKGHRRIMSDPFDNPELDDGTKTTMTHHHEGDLLDEGQLALPTLQRFPFAETNNRSCWSEPPVKVFSVRGAGYLTDKKKIPSQKYLLTPRGCDLFLSDNPGECKMER